MKTILTLCFLAFGFLYAEEITLPTNVVANVAVQTLTLDSVNGDPDGNYYLSVSKVLNSQITGSDTEGELDIRLRLRVLVTAQDQASYLGVSTNDYRNTAVTPAQKEAMLKALAFQKALPRIAEAVSSLE